MSGGQQMSLPKEMAEGIVTTELGRFRRVNTGTDYPNAWTFECPKCGVWAYMDEDQWMGRVSVEHDCGYHETHHYMERLAQQIVVLLGMVWMGLISSEGFGR